MYLNSDIIRGLCYCINLLTLTAAFDLNINIQISTHPLVASSEQREALCESLMSCGTFSKMHGQIQSWHNFSSWMGSPQVVRAFSTGCDKDLYTKITFPHVVVKSTSRCFGIKQHTPSCKMCNILLRRWCLSTTISGTVLTLCRLIYSFWQELKQQGQLYK